MLEALILQHLTTHISRNLNAQASRLLSGHPNGHSPHVGESDSTGRHTPSSASGASITQPSLHVDQFLQSYMKMQADLEKIHSYWPKSQATLSPPDTFLSKSGESDEEDLLALAIRKGKMAYETVPTKSDDIVIPSLPKSQTDRHLAGPEDLFKDEENYYYFAWPVVLHSQNAVAHATSFGRALLYEIGERLDIRHKSMPIE